MGMIMFWNVRPEYLKYSYICNLSAALNMKNCLKRIVMLHNLCVLCVSGEKYYLEISYFSDSDISQ